MVGKNTIADWKFVRDLSSRSTSYNVIYSVVIVLA